MKVEVVIVKAEHLPNMDTFAKSDPYVVCEVQGTPKCEFKTPVINNCLDPFWNHKEDVEWDGSGDIVFRVYDKDVVSADDFIGKVVLPAAVIRQGHEGSITLRQNPQKGKEGAVVVGKDKQTSTLEIKVTPEEVVRGSGGDCGCACVIA